MAKNNVLKSLVTTTCGFVHATLPNVFVDFISNEALFFLLLIRFDHIIWCVNLSTDLIKSVKSKVFSDSFLYFGFSFAHSFYIFLSSGMFTSFYLYSSVFISFSYNVYFFLCYSFLYSPHFSFFLSK